jgi:hypothetical protein
MIRVAFGKYAWCLLQPNNPMIFSLFTKKHCCAFCKRQFRRATENGLPCNGLASLRVSNGVTLWRPVASPPAVFAKVSAFFCERDTSRSDKFLLVNVHPYGTITF